MAGLLHTVPAQATVMMLYSSGVSPQLTITTGVGLSMLPGFICILGVVFMLIKTEN